MTPEQLLTKQIMLWCGEHNWLCFHTNVGSVLTADNRIFNTGLPVGFPDLLIITDDSRTLFIETKIHPRKPTADQIKCQENLRKRGFISDTVYSLEEFINITSHF